MIVKISRGGRTQGLMAYLAGPGRSNEHEAPHLVAGSPGLMAWYSTDELSQGSATSIGNHLDVPRRITGTEITTAVKAFDEAAGVRVATGERRAAHVWHCSLSLPPGTEPLGDETWGAIAGDFAAGMGFTQASGKAPCRWAAVHHGASVNGGDHIHLAVALVREDGTKASTHNDYKTASRLVGELERTHGLEVVAGREVGKSARPEIRAEVERAAAAGATETYSRRLGRTVRACATSAATEDEFVRRARAEGLWVRPRFAAGSQDVITGFAVAEQPAAGERAVWKAAGHLGRDLTLPRLRESWPDEPEHAAAAAAEWRAAWRGEPVVGEGRENGVPEERLWQAHADEMARLREQLRGVDVEDHATWSRVARETSGVFAAWSLRTEATPGPMADASDQLAKAAALHARTIRNQPGRPVSLRGPAYLVMQLAAGTGSRTGQALLLRQLLNTMRAIHDAQVASSQAREAAQVASTVRDRLASVVAGLRAVPADAVDAQRGGVAMEVARPGNRDSPSLGTATAYDDPVPNPLGVVRPAAKPAGTRSGRSTGGAER